MDILGTLIGGLIAAVIVIAIFVRLLSWLYIKSSGDVALVRTGFGGAKVVTSGGALVIPVIHQTTAVSLSTQRLEVHRGGKNALQTRDNMRVDVTATFYMHVQPDKEALLRAAATLGSRTMNAEVLSGLVEGKLVDALRASAAESDMRTLHEERGDFVKRVGSRVRDELLVNGLVLESVSLTEFDQTDRQFFNPANAFDSEGLTQLARTTEDRRRQRNEIERDTELAIQRKALDVEAKQLEMTKNQLQIEREAEFAKLQQKQDVAQRRAEQQAAIAQEEAAQAQAARGAQIEAERLVQEAEIAARRQVEGTRIEADQAIEQARIGAERAVKEQELKRAEALDLVALRRSVVVQSAEHDRDVELAKKALQRALSQAESEAGQLRSRETVELAAVELKRATEIARLEVDKAVSTRRIESERDVKALETAKSVTIDTGLVEREKLLEIAEHERVIAVAAKAAQRFEALIDSDKKHADAVAQEQAVVTAREAAIADGKRRIAELEAGRALITARGQAEAERARLAGDERRHQVEAEARGALSEADNRMSSEQVRLRLQLAMLDRLPDIIRESAKPVEAIDKIQIIQVEGLGGGGSGPTTGGAPGDCGAVNFADQVMTSALRYRAQAPVVDAVLAELGLNGASLNGLAKTLPAALAGAPEAAVSQVPGPAAAGPSALPGPVEARP